MGDGIPSIPGVITFDIACQINSSVVAQRVSVTFVISNTLLTNAYMLCCYCPALSLMSH